ncbi:hypothetical protein DB347_07410 [Opitutaceae bacterium EW11]|nr:hypothetical protein DB347_07410 [Opitutaceae bacterium EW11]
MTTPAPSPQPHDNVPPLPSAPKTSGMAVASLILGILSVMGGAILLFPMVLAIVLGHIAYSKTNKDPSVGGRGIALAGLILGYASIFFGIIVAGLLAAMAIPAFQKVRDESLMKAMQNDARQIGAAAQQVMLEKGTTRVVFTIDPQTGAVSGPISQYVTKVSRGTVAVDGTIENETDTFSLKNPQCHQGQVLTFDAEGKRVQ